MKILKAGTHGHFDVFTGNGWKGWTRVQVVKKVVEGKVETSLRFVSGRHLPPSAVKQVASAVIPQP